MEQKAQQQVLLLSSQRTALRVQPSSEIPGSRSKPGEEVRAFRKRWECLTSTGAAHWALNPHPGELPWPRTRFLGPCGDRAGYAGAWSNLDVTNGSFTEDHWPVAESLKYVWEAKSGGEGACGGGPAPSLLGLDGQRFCSALQKTKGSLFIVATPSRTTSSTPFCPR